MQTGKLLKEYGRGIRSDVVAFSPDGKTLAASQPRRFMLWNLIDGSSKNLPIPKEFEMGAIRFHKDSSKIYAVPYNQGNLLEIDLANEKINEDFSTATVSFSAVAISDYPVATSPEKTTFSIAASMQNKLVEFLTSGIQYSNTDLPMHPSSVLTIIRYKVVIED